ncbi:hypothetical protein M2175_001262 [Bradyrhizobium elkanii]|nr:hypothetical protein [Bradyrhizobium elkanii]MCS3966784.1 hypothetical protein [Bradyrhizobium japonicum]
MGAARKQVENINDRMFEDVVVLQRKWQAG